MTPTTSAQIPPSPPRTAPAPLGPVLAFGFLNSLGTGTVTNGVFFLTRESYGFSDAANYALGITMGLCYIAGALGVGPAIARLAAASTAITHRRVLIALMLLLAAACLIPPLAGKAAPWAAWVTVLIYGPLTGALWPVFESFLAGGRRDRVLRKTIGRFNISWALAVAASFWLMSPVIESFPLLVFAGLGVVHVLSTGLLAWFPPDPAKHADTHLSAPPPEYIRLLPIFRLLLPLSYVTLSALGPFLPFAFARVGLDAGAGVLAASVWMSARVVVFAVMEAWHGWRGRGWLAGIGTVLLLGGFVIAVFGPALAPTDLAGLALMLVGLAGLGCGMGSIYYAALYYAMTVGDARVDAGGTHEALIGLGYTVGPAFMLLAWLAETKSAGLFEPVASGLLGLATLVVVILSIHRSKHDNPPPVQH